MNTSRIILYFKPSCPACGDPKVHTLGDCPAFSWKRVPPRVFTGIDGVEVSDVLIETELVDG